MSGLKHAENAPNEMIKLRIAVVQLESHPAFAIEHTDWLGEPFFSPTIACLKQLEANGFAAAEDLRELCRSRYLSWAEHRLKGVLSWFKERFASEKFLEMPDIIVFPEGGVAREHLTHLVDFAKETKAVIFAGTHTFEVSDTAKKAYEKLGIVFQNETTSQEITDATHAEATRILNKDLGSIAVLPIIKPNDAVAQKDASGNQTPCIVY